MNRREFLKAAAVAIAGAFVPFRQAPEQDKEPTTRAPLTKDDAIAIADKAWELGLSLEVAILAGFMASICRELQAGIKYLEWKARSQGELVAV